MDWLVSLMMLWWYWAAGNKIKGIWLYSVGINVTWIIYAVTIKEYGLILSSSIIGAIAIRNHIKWGNDERKES